MILKEILNSSWTPLSEMLPFYILIPYIMLTLIVEIGIFWIFLDESEKFKRVAFVCLIANVVSAVLGFVMLLLVSL